MEEQKRTEAYHKSRLGQILIKKGYISQPQLDEAVHSSENSSEDTAKLLGEYLIEHRIISRWQLRRALSSQTQLRLSASLAMVLLNPLYDLLTEKNCESLNDTLVSLVRPLLTKSPAPLFEFDPNQASVEVKDNGFLRLRIPSSLGEITFDKLRLKTCAPRNCHDLTLDDLDLSDTRLFIRTIHNKLNPALPES